MFGVDGGFFFFFITHHPESDLDEQYRAGSITGILSALCFIDELLPKIHIQFFFPAAVGGTTAYTDPVTEAGLALDQKNQAFASIQD